MGKASTQRAPLAGSVTTLQSRPLSRPHRDVPRMVSRVEEAVLDNELRGDAKLLVSCWAALETVSGYSTATILDAVTLANGLRGMPALRWVAGAVVADARNRPEPALPRYLSVDWPRLHRWALELLEGTEGPARGVQQRLAGPGAVSIPGIP